MVLLKLKCPPDRRQALVVVDISTSSPTLSLSSPSQDPFQLIVNLRLAHTTLPARPITIKTSHTIFSPAPDSGLDTLALGTVGGLVSATEPDRKIHLGNFKDHRIPRGEAVAPDLRQRPDEHLLTIPAEGGEVTVRHNLSMERMLKYEERLAREDLRPGEKWRIRLADGYVGTTWWCWGGLNEELQGKKLSAWQPGINFERTLKPSDEIVEQEGWVLGENPAELEFENHGYAEFEFVE